MVDVSGYELHEQIGSGGVGDVFRATQRSTGATVAIKLVRHNDDDEGMWRRIERELKALVELVGHANVVGVVELVMTTEGRALVMEYAPGGSLADLVQRSGPLSVEETVLVGRQIASAVAAAHERGIVHRDIKPHNVLVDGYGQAKLCDFGIASLLRSAELRERASAVSMRYASPEDLEDEGDLVGPPSDVYSLGATLLFLRRGAPPTTIERVGGWVPVTDPSNPAATELDAVIADLLLPSPYSRPTMRVAYERLNDLDRRLETAVESLLADESELFPAVGTADPDLLFPDNRRDQPPPAVADESSFAAPPIPMSPRLQKPGTRTISPPAPALGSTRSVAPVSSARTARRHDEPSEAALTAAFGPVADPGRAPTRAEEINRFWEDDTVYRDDPPPPGSPPPFEPDEEERRRWPIVLILVAVLALAGVGVWQFTSRSGGTPSADSLPSTVPATGVAVTIPLTTIPPTTVPPTTAPPTTVPPTTTPPTTVPPTTAAPAVPTEPRPPGLADLAGVARPRVEPGTCLVQADLALVAVDCGQPHDLQMIATVQADSSSAVAPTEDSIKQAGRLLCSNRFIDLVHGNDTESAQQTLLTLQASTPDLAGWVAGDRTVECWVLVPDQRLIGSAIGSGW